MATVQSCLDLDRGLSLPRLPSIVNEGVADRLSNFLFGGPAQPASLPSAVQQQQQPTSQPAAVSEAEPKPAAAYSAICTTGYHMRAAPEPSYPGSAVTTNQALGGYARVTTTGAPAPVSPKAAVTTHFGLPQTVHQPQAGGYMIHPQQTTNPQLNPQLGGAQQPVSSLVPIAGSAFHKPEFQPPSPFASMANAFNAGFEQLSADQARINQMNQLCGSGGSQGSGSSTGHGNGSFTNQGSGSGLDLGGDDEDYSYPGSPGRQPRRSSRRRTNRLNLTEDGELKPKNKVGRPIAYNGDPNSPHLTEHEKRRIKRRIANRESARRVRQKRQDVLEEMNIKMQQMQMHHMQLMRHLQESEQHKQVMYGQLSEVKQKWKASALENAALQRELHSLRARLHLASSPKAAEDAGAAGCNAQSPKSPKARSPNRGDPHPHRPDAASSSPPQTPPKAATPNAQQGSLHLSSSSDSEHVNLAAAAPQATTTAGAAVATVTITRGGGQVGSASDALLDIPDGFGSMELLGDPALCHMLA